MGNSKNYEVYIFVLYENTLRGNKNCCILFYNVPKSTFCPVPWLKCAKAWYFGSLKTPVILDGGVPSTNSIITEFNS